MSSLLRCTAVFSAVLFLVTPLFAQTAEKCALVQRSYPVADLVVPIPDLKVSPPGTTAPAAPVATEQATLMQLLEHKVATTTWQKQGGAGSIEYSPSTMSLIIKQKPEVHKQVADLLASLRKFQEVQVALDVRLVSLPEETFERIGIDFNSTPSPDVTSKGEKPTATTQFLNAEQLKTFLAAVQGDRRANNMQAPKLTMLNGQTATIQMSELNCPCTSTLETQQCPASPTGFHLTAQPQVSADNRFVKLALKTVLTPGNSTNQSDPAQQSATGTLSIERTVVIPDGHTMLLGRFALEHPVRYEYGPPLLSKVPYVNRLFKNVAYGVETQSLYVLVTPRIIVSPEVCPIEKCAFSPCADQEHLTRKNTPSARQAHVVTVLLKAYQEACTEGREAEAGQFARAALAIDPTCFHKKR